VVQQLLYGIGFLTNATAEAFPSQKPFNHTFKQDSISKQKS
jgi:hypothetical protein